GAILLCRQALSVQIRQSLAAPVPEPASADLDTLARLRVDHPLGRAHALHLLSDAKPDRSGGALLPAVSRRGRQGGLQGLARPTRLVEHDLRGRDRRNGGAGSAAAPGSAYELFPENADPDAAAARLYRSPVHEAGARRPG